MLREVITSRSRSRNTLSGWGKGGSPDDEGRACCSRFSGGCRESSGQEAALTGGNGLRRAIRGGAAHGLKIAYIGRGGANIFSVCPGYAPPNAAGLAASSTGAPAC
ncbi:MAG: hypothetical protein ACLVIW_05845 [Bilophila wadsworthia]